MENDNKKCDFCGEEIKISAVKCKHCNEWLNKNEITVNKYSSKVSTEKFITLYFATFGIYILFWMYGQWKFLKNQQNINVSPFWRSVFSNLWAGSLAGHIKRFLKEKNIIVTYSPGLIGVSFFIINILVKLPAPYWLITFLSFIPILPVLESMNQYYEENEKDLQEKKLVWWQIILIGLGLIFVALTVYDAIYPF